MVTNGFYCDAEFIVATCDSFIKICCPLKCAQKLEENPKLHKSTSVLAAVSEGKSFILCGYMIAHIDFTGLPDGHMHRVHTDWQWPLSGVHSIMMEKSAQLGEDWGVHADPLSLYSIYHHVQRVVYAPAERADTLP
jgi:hypothetical protein